MQRMCGVTSLTRLARRRILTGPRTFGYRNGPPPEKPATNRRESMTQGEQLIRMKVLMVDDELAAQTASGRAARALAQELRERDVVVVEATSADDGQAVVLSDPSLQGVLLDWTLSDDDAAHDKAKALIDSSVRATPTSADLSHHRARRCGQPHGRGDARSRRVDLDAGGHHVLHCRARAGRDAPLPRSRSCRRSPKR